MKRLELALTVAMAAAALVVAVIAVSDRFGGVKEVRVASQHYRLESTTQWEDLRLASRRVGSDSTGPVFVVLSDFECPACREYHKELMRRRAAGARFELRFAHFPLPYHRFAGITAKIAECSAVHDRFEEAVHVLYDAQDSLGIIGWDALLVRGHSDSSIARLRECFAQPDDDARFELIQRGRRVGEEIGLTATPFVVVDGVVYPQPPRGRRLDELLASGGRVR